MAAFERALSTALCARSSASWERFDASLVFFPLDIFLRYGRAREAAG